MDERASPGSDDDLSTLKWYYEQNLAMASIFFEWRHKILSLGIGAASALVAVSAALNSTNRFAASAPAFVGSLISFAVILVNERFAIIMRSTYVIGHQLEERIAARLSLEPSTASSELGYNEGPFMVLRGHQALAPGLSQVTEEQTATNPARSSGVVDAHRSPESRLVALVNRFRSVSFTFVIRWLAALVAVVCLVTTFVTIGQLA